MIGTDELAWVYLTLPNHEHRCLCGVFGLPNVRRVIDRDGTEHDADKCQPARESMRGRR